MRKELPNKKTIIIFTGGPGTGKSSTVEKFLEYIDNDNIIKISVDSIKEKNWDLFGFNNLEQKERLNEWSLEEFYLTIQKNMWLNDTILIEYPFYQKHREKLSILINENDYKAVTIFLYTDMKTLYRRGANRDKFENRHPAHFLENYHIETHEKTSSSLQLDSELSFDKFEKAISHKIYNINLGLVISVDVTNFNNINYRSIYKKIIEY